MAKGILSAFVPRSVDSSGRRKDSSLLNVVVSFSAGITIL